MDIAIIGAGLAGLAAARRLHDAGLAPVVFDKSRGLGGRLASRRREGFAFDHGAPGVAPSGGGLAAYLAAAESAGAAVPLAGGSNSHRGVPGMSALVKPLAEGIEIRRETTLGRIEAEGGRLTLQDAGGRALGAFDRVICAIPAPQAARVAEALLDDAARDALAAVVMDPCWTLMLGWANDAAMPPDISPERLPAGIGSAVAGPGGQPTLVAHATPAWSLANLERGPEDVVAEMLAQLRQAADLAEPRIAMAHRWRFARTAAPLGRPFLALAGGGLRLGGDWALGPDAGHAWTSGRAMAEGLSG